MGPGLKTEGIPGRVPSLLCYAVSQMGDGEGASRGSRKHGAGRGHPEDKVRQRLQKGPKTWPLITPSNDRSSVTACSFSYLLEKEKQKTQNTEDTGQFRPSLNEVQRCYHIQKDYADNTKRPFMFQRLHKEALTPS